MSELPTITTGFEAETSSGLAARVDKMRRLLANPDVKWWLEKIVVEDARLVKASQDLSLTMEQRDTAVKKLAGLRDVVRIPQEELETAIRAFQELQKNGGNPSPQQQET